MAVSSIEQRYEDFFEAPLRTLLVDHQLSSTEQGDNGRWHGFRAEIRDVDYRIAFLRGEKSAVRIVIDSSDDVWNKSLFDGLLERRESIEAGISASLDWEYIEGRRRCIISAVGAGDIADPKETWIAMQDWMVDRLLEFRRVFEPHLQELAGGL